MGLKINLIKIVFFKRSVEIYWSYFQLITGTLISVFMQTGQSDLSIGGLQMTSGHSGGGGQGKKKTSSMKSLRSCTMLVVMWILKKMTYLAK